MLIFFYSKCRPEHDRPPVYAIIRYDPIRADFPRPVAAGQWSSPERSDHLQLLRLWLAAAYVDTEGHGAWNAVRSLRYALQLRFRQRKYINDIEYY